MVARIKDKILDLIGVILILITILNIIIHIKTYRDYFEIFWFCNLSALICGIGLITKKKEIVSSVLIAAIPAQFMWIVDFLLNFIFGYSFGRTLWLRESTYTIFLISTYLHLFVIPSSLYGTYCLGYSKKAYKYAIIIFIILLLPITYFFTPFEENINCVFYPCDLIYEINYKELSSSTYFGTFYYLLNQIIYWIGISFFMDKLLIIIFRKLKWKVS